MPAKVAIKLVLLLACWETLLVTASKVKGDSLRRHRGLKLQSPKRTQLNHEGRHLQAEDLSRSRIGSFGHEDDPFLEADLRQNIGPYEIEEDGSESESETSHHRLASSQPPLVVLEDEFDIDFPASNQTMDSFTLLTENYTTTEPVPFVSQAMESLPATTPSAVEQAQMAGQSIVSGVTSNLATGRKGVKGSSSKTTAATTTGEARKSGVKGVSKKSTSGAYVVKSQKSKKGLKSATSGLASAKSKSSKGVAGVSSAYGAECAGGGKGSKSKIIDCQTGTSGSGDYVAPSGTVVSPGVENPVVSTAPAPAPTLVPGAISTPEPFPTPWPDSQFPTTSAPGPEYPPTRDGAAAPQVDCDAIRDGTAGTETEPASFTAKADWVLADGAVFDDVAAGVQRYLQTELAPAIAGCQARRKKRRRLQFITASPLITNVVFEKPTSPGEGTCVIDGADRCFATEEDIDIYYLGVGTGLGARLLSFLENAAYDIDGLLDVANFKLFDSNGNEVVASSSNPEGLDGNGGTSPTGSGTSPTESGTSPTGSGTSPTGSGSTQGGDSSEGSTNGQDQDSTQVAGLQGEDVDDDDEGVSKWSRTLIGVCAATAFLGTILCVLLYRRCRQHHDERDEKVDFESLGPEQYPEGAASSRKVDASSGAVYLGGQPDFSRTWPDNDDHSENSEEEIDTTTGRATRHSGEQGEIQVEYTGSTHVCTSAYCEVCAHNRPRIQFISSAIEEPEHLPVDATRNYAVDDTVDL